MKLELDVLTTGAASFGQALSDPDEAYSQLSEELHNGQGHVSYVGFAVRQGKAWVNLRYACRSIDDPPPQCIKFLPGTLHMEKT